MISPTVSDRALSPTQAGQIPQPRFLIPMLYCCTSQDELCYAVLADRQLQNLSILHSNC